MKRFVPMVAVLFTLVLSAAGPAMATEPHERTGFFIGFGFGGGNAAWDWGFESDDDPSEGSGTGNFRIGGAVRDNLVLGLESSAWVKEWDLESGGANVGTVKLTFSAATFGATWFPGNNGFYVRGGAGIATVTGEVDFSVALPDIDEEDQGLALLGATGFEWRLTRKFALAPQVELVFLGIDGDLVENAIVVDGGLQFNWYW